MLYLEPWGNGSDVLSKIFNYVKGFIRVFNNGHMDGTSNTEYLPSNSGYEDVWGFICPISDLFASIHINRY